MSGTVVYIDAANIVLAAKKLEFDLDMTRLITHLKDSYRPSRVIYFTAKFRSKQKEYDAIAALGVEIVYKQIYNEGLKVKANCDVEISHRITRDILDGVVDHAILLSGDGDFVCLCDFAKARDVAMKVVAFDPSSCSLMIKRRAFVRVSYLVELGGILKNEKPPAST